MSSCSSSFDDEGETVVIDNGSYRIKAGLSGDCSPKSYFPTVVGRAMYEEHSTDGKHVLKYYIGEEAVSKSPQDLNRPIERGVVTNWEDMERIWHYIFNTQLRMTPEDTSVLVTEPPLNPKSNKEKMVHLMFEKFLTPSVLVIYPNILSLMASGRTTGVVLDSGFELTHVCCMYDGYIIPNSVFRSEIGGNDVTDYLVKLLGKRGFTFTTDKERGEVDFLKQKAAYAPCESQIHFTLSDGNCINVGQELPQCLEIMFQPGITGMKSLGIQDLIKNSIHSCPVDVREDLYKNIILSGSNTMHRGIVERLENYLSTAVPKARTVKVIAPPERRSSTWIGGCILGGLTHYKTDFNWTSIEDYREYGPNIVYRRCCVI